MKHTTNARCGQGRLSLVTRRTHDKHDREQTICTSITHLTEDITTLMTHLVEYAEQYEMPARVIARVYELGDALSDAAQAVDPEAQQALEDMQKQLRLDEQWDMRTHYACEPGDYWTEEY